MSINDGFSRRACLRACASPRGRTIALLGASAACVVAAVAVCEPALVLIALFPALASIGQR
jgi:hypothetical protein